LVLLSCIMTTTLPTLNRWADLAPTQQTTLRQTVPIGDIIGIATPSTQPELAETIQAAQRENWQVLAYGNGSKLDWGGVIRGDRPILVVSLAHLNRLIEHAAADMTVTLEAGMKFADLQATLATARQFFPADPRYFDQATIGGVMATADSGSLRHRYSSLRDLVLGVTFVRSDGELVKAGGRVVKNVAGYDLMKLMTGAYGTLGVIAQVTLRVYPIQPVSQTLVLAGDLANLGKLAQTLLNSALTPLAIDWLSTQAMTDLGLGNSIGLIVRFQTVAESVAVQRQRVEQLATALDLAVIVYPTMDEAQLWQRIGAIGESGLIRCKIGLQGSEALAAMQQIEKFVPGAIAIIHAGSGLGRLVLPSADALNKLRSICQKYQGFLSILSAPIEVKQSIEVWGYTSNAAELMQAVKKQFDPQGLFSPDRMKL
jgi:glycolate oxidase FAD binding subunit